MKLGGEVQRPGVDTGFSLQQMRGNVVLSFGTQGRAGATEVGTRSVQRARLPGGNFCPSKKTLAGLWDWADLPGEAWLREGAWHDARDGRGRGGGAWRGARAARGVASRGVASRLGRTGYLPSLRWIRSWRLRFSLVYNRSRALPSYLPRRAAPRRGHEPAPRPAEPAPRPRPQRLGK